MVRILLVLCALLACSRGEEDHHDHEGKDAFDLFLKEFNRTTALKVEDLSRVTAKVFANLACTTDCSQCLQNISTTLNVNTTSGVNEEQFHSFTTVLLHYARDANRTCRQHPTAAKNISEYVRALMTDHGVTGGHFTDHHLEHILAEVKPLYKSGEEDHDDHDHEHGHEHKESAETKECFSATSVFHDAGLESTMKADDHELGAVTSLVIYNLYEGHPIGPCQTQNDVLKNKFKQSFLGLVGAQNMDVFTEEEFEGLLEKLNIGSAKSAATPPADGHEGHDHKRSIRYRRETAAGDLDAVNKCFSGEDLLTIYGVNHSAGVTFSQMQTICPTLLQQQIGNHCVIADVHTEPVTCPKLSIAEMCGWGSLAVFIISLSAIAGILIIPCASSTLFEHLMILFIALAVGTMSGDAILHLIPQALGLHAHDHGTSCNSTAEAKPAEIAVQDYVWKQLAAIGAIYFFFLLETLMHAWRSRRNAAGDDTRHGAGHGHSHIPDSVVLKTISEHANGHVENGHSIVLQTNSTADLTKNEIGNSQLSLKDDEKVSIANAREKSVKGFPMLAFMVLLGDSIHNFADGMAIGAAFTQDARTGIATSIAVLCHEVPHEFGDFAVLLSTGVGYKMALALNFVSALTAFGGLFLGVFLAVDEAVRQWIFAVTAGMFIYIALADMLPELIRMSPRTSRCKTFFLQQAGILIGFLIMVIIAVFEEHIVV